MDINEEMLTKLKKVQDIIGYKYVDISNLVEACIHSSYANEKKRIIRNNERLEFLGDAVLQLVISEYIFKKHPEMPEGDMSKARSKIVCEPTLADFARTLGLEEFLILGKGEELTGGRKRESLIADLVESVIGSIYVDGGLEEAKEFVIEKMEDVIREGINDEIILDFKTHLQEIIHKNGNQPIEYQIVDELGPDHDKTFVAQVLLDGKVCGKGSGATKKEAEQEAVD